LATERDSGIGKLGFEDNSCNSIEISCKQILFDHSGTERCSLPQSRSLWPNWVNNIFVFFIFLAVFLFLWFYYFSTYWLFDSICSTHQVIVRFTTICIKRKQTHLMNEMHSWQFFYNGKISFIYFNHQTCISNCLRLNISMKISNLEVQQMEFI
jgi:hypothetical protein